MKLTHDEAVGTAEHEASTSEQIHHAVTQHATAEVHENAARHANASPKTLQHMYSTSVHPEPEDQATHKSIIAGHPNAPRQIVKEHFDKIEPHAYDHSEHSDILFHPNITPDERSEKVKHILAQKVSPDDHDSDDEILPKKIRLSSDHKALLSDFLGHEDTDTKTVGAFINHPHPEVAAYAATSPNATLDHVNSFFQRKDINAEHIKKAVHNEYRSGDDKYKDVHPEFLEKAYNALKTMKPVAANHYYGDNPKQVAESLLEHPNTPRTILDQVIGRKANKKAESLSHYNESSRVDAFKHPNVSKEEVADWVQKGDVHAMQAAVGRHDTDEQTLRTIDSHGHDSLSLGMLRHPNYPHDLTKKAVHESADHARAVLKRDEVHPEILTEILKHKNQKVAMEALDHASITPQHILDAYNRKAKEVSKAAAAHRLAPMELKLLKGKDPEAAKQIIAESEDPEAIRQLHEMHSSNHDIRKAVGKNKNTPSDVLNKLVDHHLRPNKNNQDNDSRDWDYGHSLSGHPNLDETGRAKFLKTDPTRVSSHPSLTSKEITDTLSDWRNRTGEDSTEKTHEFAKQIFDHPNLSPEDAKDLAVGKYGKLGQSNKYSSWNDSFHHIHKNPNTFTRDVALAGVNAPEELQSGDLVHEFAKSPHLTPQELDEIVRRPTPNDDLGRAHHIERTTGALSNAKLSDDTAKDILSGVDPNLSKPTNIEAVLKNKAVKDEHIDALTRNRNVNLEQDSAKLLAGRVHNYDNPDRANLAMKETVHPSVAKALLDGGAGYNSVRIAHGVDNKNPDVLHAVLDHMDEQHKPKRDQWGRMIRPEVSDQFHASFNKLAEHPDKEIAARAVKYMSPEKQQAAIGKLGLDNPDMIKGLNEDMIRNMKIKPDMDHDAAQALIDHHAATPEHFLQAVQHSDSVAYHALSSFDNPDKGARKEKFEPRFEREDMEKIMSEAVKKHPTSTAVLTRVAEHSRDPKVLKQLLLNPEHAAGAYSTLAKNPQLRGGDLEDVLTKFHGPEHSEAMGQFADSEKATVGLLNHMVEHFPEHNPKVAKNPRAATAKVLKKLLQDDNVETKVNLVNNEAVPHGVKDELLKDKHVLFKAKPNSVDHKELVKYAKDEDLSIAHAAIDHVHATSEVADAAVKNAFKRMKEDPENSLKIIKTTAKKNFLEPDTQAKLLLHSPEVAADVIRHSAKGGPFNKQATLDAMDRFQNTPGYQKMLKSLVDASALKDPNISHRIIDSLDLNQVDDEGMANSHVLAKLFSGRYHDTNNHLSGEHYTRALVRMEQERPATYKYAEDKNGKAIRDGDLKLMSTLLGDAPDQALNKYADNPAFAPIVAQNPKVKKDNFTRALTHVLNTGENLGPDNWEKIIDHKSATSEHLDGIYNHLMKNPEVNIQGLRSIAKSSRITPDQATKIYKELGWSGTIEPNIVKNPILPEHVLKKHAQLTDMGLKQASENPNFRLDMAKPEQLEHPQHRQEVFENVSNNHYADPKDLHKIWSHPDSEHSPDIIRNLIRNVKTDESLISKMKKSRGVNEKDLFENPAVGGKLWREQEHKFPKEVAGNHVPDSEINEAVFRPREEKIKQVMQMIPKGGFLDWAEFKKSQPNLAGDPIVQKMFTSAQKTRVDQSHAEKYLQEMPARKFHVSYQSWTGMQRHNEQNGPQTVFLLNNGESMDQHYQNNPHMTGLYRTVQLANQNVGHPHGPQAIGWSRVDTSHEDHWFVDEIQSDFNSDLSKELHHINKHGQTKGMEEFGLKPEEGEKAVNTMVDMMNGWEKALLQNIIDTAKKNGASKISIHSGESKTMVNKSEASEVTNKYDKIYNRMPQEMGFKPAKYEDLPNAGKKNGLKGKQIWTLDIGEAEQALKQKPEKQQEAEQPSAQPRVK